MTRTMDWLSSGWKKTGREWTAKNGCKFYQWQYTPERGPYEWAYRLSGTDDCWVEQRGTGGWRAVVFGETSPTRFRELHTAAAHVADAFEDWEDDGALRAAHAEYNEAHK